MSQSHSAEPRSATVFSLVADPPRATATATDPHAQFDRATLVDAADDRYACHLQRLSTAGATLSISEGPEPGAAVKLELANGQSIAARIDWCDKDAAGLVFDEPIDVIGTLARNLVSLPADRRSMPRVELNQTLSLRSGDHFEHARTRNISQGGVGIETRLPLHIGDTVDLTFDSLRPLKGAVRWTAPNLVGIAFDEELGWQTLMPWLRQMQHQARASAAAQAATSLEQDGMIPDKHVIRLDAPANVREGARWWNARVRGLTTHHVELQTRASFIPGAQLWVSLPQIGGGPAAVIEARHDRVLCEFRLPLRPREVGMIGAR